MNQQLELEFLYLRIKKTDSSGGWVQVGFDEDEMDWANLNWFIRYEHNQRFAFELYLFNSTGAKVVKILESNFDSMKIDETKTFVIIKELENE